MKNHSAVAFLCFGVFSAGGPNTWAQDDYDRSRDYFSFANTEQVVTRHIELDLTVNFSDSLLPILVARPPGHG